MPSQPGCIALRASGGLLVALRSGLAVLDTQGGALSEVSPPPYEQATTRFNDGRCDVGGRLWVGSIYEPRDRPNAALFSVEQGVIRDSGRRGTVLNGIAFSPDNRTFYHSDTTSHSIYACDFDPVSGDLSGDRLLKSFSRDKTQPDYGGRPDGATIDSEGAYWCAMYEGGRLLRLSTDGDVLQEISLPVRCPTMMAFGGKDLRTLYITTVSKGRSEAELGRYPLSGQLLSLRMDVAGRAEHFYEG
jgi:sugar lactone lactonase YvrE